LIEFVVRRGLFGNDQESLAGLYPSNPGRKTSSPTTERLLDVFEGVTLHRFENHREVWVQVTPLSPLQRRIVQLMELPEDVIFCRNVFIYLRPEAIRAITERFERALAPSGFLFLGHAETLWGVPTRFELRQVQEACFYQLGAEDGDRVVQSR
jgi:chemotaxis methyl-accepting protein methylase